MSWFNTTPVTLTTWHMEEVVGYLQECVLGILELY